MPPLRKQREKSNGACFSCIAPSGEELHELRAFEVVLIHSSDDLYHVCTWQVYAPITPHWKVL